MSIHPLFQPLHALVVAAGVSGSEEPVANVLAGMLAERGIPEEMLRRDALGNRWLEFGLKPGDQDKGGKSSFRPKRLLAAHMDEIGLRITSIRPDGMCRVQAIGGIDPQLWEGSRVVVHTRQGQIMGCIAPVSLHVTQRSGLGPTQRLKAEDLYLDLGVGNAGGVQGLGVQLLDPITWPKGLDLLAGLTVQGRSLDDRFGCLALVELAAILARNVPEVPTVVAWTVQEELGLRGARALAARFPACEEVIAVDSFTVGMGPRDNRQFDSVWLGAGPALRAWDATSLMPDAARNELLAIASAAGINLQYGHMPGGNDASVWEPSAVAHCGMSARAYGLGIPVQYSHSMVERANLGDLEGLINLLRIIACPRA